MRSVSLITCTGTRPEAFALCEAYMARQTYTGPRQWIVVDDGETKTPVTQDQQVLRPYPFWKPGENTLARNMLVALEWVTGDVIFFIEDDDWYAPDFLEKTLAAIEGVDLAGQGRAKYYHVGARLYYQNVNETHASLCQTAMTRAMIPALQMICQSEGEFFDRRLWHGADQKFLFGGPDLCVGIKGLPGRLGIGIGHRPPPGYDVRDPELTLLASWIGAEDAERYRGFYHGA